MRLNISAHHFRVVNTIKEMVSTLNNTKAQLLKKRLTVAFLLLLNLHPLKAVSMLYTALWFYFNDDRIRESHKWLEERIIRMENLYFKMQDENDVSPITDFVNKYWQSVIENREEILRAFIAKYGYEPDEVEQIEQHTPGLIRWYVRKREDNQAVASTDHTCCSNCKREG